MTEKEIQNQILLSYKEHLKISISYLMRKCKISEEKASKEIAKFREKYA